MEDTTDVRKSPRKKQKSSKLTGYYMTGSGETVLMSKAQGVSFNDSDDSQLKIKATTKRKILSSDEDTMEEEHNKENDHEDSSSAYPDDGPNLDWHILPNTGETEDHNIDECTSTKRLPISILAEVHSASPPGYVSTKRSHSDKGSPNDCESPITSPVKNGCVVWKEDRIFSHKRPNPGDPTRKSKRIGRETFKKPADPPQQSSDASTSSAQAASCLAGTSVQDSPVSEPSISPACRNIEEELNKGPVVNEDRTDMADVGNGRGNEMEQTGFTKLKQTLGPIQNINPDIAQGSLPDDINPDIAQGSLPDDEHPMIHLVDDAASVVSVASSGITIIMLDDLEKEQDVEILHQGTDDNSYDQMDDLSDGAGLDKADGSKTKQKGRRDAQSDKSEVVTKGIEAEGVEIISEVTNEASKEPLDESDILDALMDSSFTSAKSTSPKKATPAKSTSPKKSTPAESTSPKKAKPTKSTSPNKVTPANSTSPKKATPANSTSPKKATPAESTSPKKATPAESTSPKKDSFADNAPASHVQTKLTSESSQPDGTPHVDIAVGQSPAISTEVCDQFFDASFNTSTEEYVSADDMPVVFVPTNEMLVDDDDFPNDIVGIAQSQHEAMMQGADSSQPLPCTPPMSPTKKENQLDNMRRSLTKDCTVRLTKTPTPPRYLTKFKSENEDGVKQRSRSKSDVDESFHTASSGDDEKKVKTVERKSQRRRSSKSLSQLMDEEDGTPFGFGRKTRPSERKQSQRRKSMKSLSQIMDEEDSESDCPVVPRKTCFASQFHKFLQLTKDLDDTPSEKGTPSAKMEDTMMQDSPATLLSKQLDDFNMNTPVAKLPFDEKVKTETSTRSRRTVKKVERFSPSSTEKRIRSTDSRKTKSKTSRRESKLTTKIKSEPPSPTDNLVKTPERKKITKFAHTPRTPVVNLAKESDVNAIQDYLSPTKLKVNVSTDVSAIKDYLSPAKLKVNVSTPAKEMKMHCSPLRLHIDVGMRSKEVERHSSPVRVALTPPPLTSLAEHFSLDKLSVQIRSPSAKVLEQMRSHGYVHRDGDKEDVMGEEHLVKETEKGILPAAERKGRSRRRSTLFTQDVAESRKQTSEDEVSEMTKEISELEHDIEQVTLYSTKKKRKGRRSLVSETTERARDEIHGSSDQAVEMASSDAVPADTGKLLDDFNIFPFDDDEEPAPSKRARKTKPAARRKSTRVRQRQIEELSENESTRSRFNSRSSAEETSVVPSRRSKAASYAGSAQDSDVESLASLGSWQSEFDDLDPFPSDAPKKRTGGRRQSLRIAKHRSLQSVGLSEEEIRQLNNRQVPASTRKHRSSSRVAREDASEVSSVVTIASDSDIVFCGVFKSPGPSTASTTSQQKGRNEEEQSLWDDFLVGFDTVKKPTKAKEKSAKSSRRMSARLHGGCSPLVEMTAQGETHEVSHQKEIRVPARRGRRGRKASDRSESVTSEMSHISDMTDDAPPVKEVDNEIHDMQAEEPGTSKRGRRRRKGSDRSESVTSEASHISDMTSEAPSVTEVDNEIQNMPVEESDTSKRGRRPRKGSDRSESVTSEVSHISDMTSEAPSVTEVDIEIQDVQFEEPDSPKRGRRQKRLTSKSRRRSSRSFKPVQLEELEICPEEVDEKNIEKLSDNVIEDVENIATSLTAESLSTEANICDTEETNRRKKKIAKRRRSSALFKPPRLSDHENDIADDNSMKGVSTSDEASEKMQSISCSQEIQKSNQEVTANAIQVDLKVGTSPTGDDVADKKAGKCRGSPSRSSKPVQMNTDEMEIIELVSENKSKDYQQHNAIETDGDFLEDMFDEFHEENQWSGVEKGHKSEVGVAGFSTSDIDKIIEEDAKSDISVSSEESGPVDDDVPLEDVLEDEEDLGDYRQIKEGDGKVISTNKNDGQLHATGYSSSRKELDDDDDDFEPSSKTKTKRAMKHKKEKTQSVQDNAMTESDGEERKSRRLSSRPKMNYAELNDVVISATMVAKQEHKNSAKSSTEKSQRRKSVHKAQPVVTEEKPKRKRKRKDNVATDEDVEQLYISRGKTVCDPNETPDDLLETIFESPVSKPSGTPILLSKRRYHRSQTFPEKPWRPRPGKVKTGRKKRGPVGRSSKKMADVDEDEITAHLDEVLAGLSELSPVAKSPKTVMTPYPRQMVSRI